MLLSFACANCHSELEADASHSGTHVTCPQCGGEVKVPIPRIEPGTTLGNFHIDEHIGSGGMGDVFRATQVSMDRNVALKVLPQALVRNSGILDRFLHEVRLSARLEHPNVVTAFEAGEDHGYYYLAMSYVEGEQLGAHLKTKGRIPEEQALRIVRQVADALAYAWDTFRILHRDIKPSNIMMDAAGKAKLMDMGISKSLVEEDAGLTVSGTLVGTPHYMSPEQAQGATDIDFRSDMYSLGATLYHLVTGSTPYSGKTTVEVLRQLALEKFPPPRERNPDLSEGCCMLLATMMARKRENRHASWQELIADVDRVLAGDLPEKLPPGRRRQAPAANRLPATHSRAPTPETKNTPHHAKDKMPPVIDFRRNRRLWLLKHGLRAGFLVLCGLALGTAVIFGAYRAGILTRKAPAVAASSSAQPIAAPAASIEQAADNLENILEDGTGERAAGQDFPAAVVLNEDAAQRLRDILDKLVPRLMDGASNEMPELVRAARSDPALAAHTQVLQDIAVMIAQAKHAAARAVMESFKDDLGKVVTVDLRDDRGRVLVSIRRVEAVQIVGTRMNESKRVALGQIEFSVSDLTPEEMMRRMAHASRRPPVAFALGMLHLRQGNTQAARDLFLRVQPDLRDALLRYIDRKPDLEKAEDVPARPAPVTPRRLQPQGRRGRRNQP